MLKIILWGTGKRANEILTNCSTLEQYNIVGVIDNDVEKVGSIFMGFRVFGIEYLEKNDVDRIVILTDFYEAIKNQIISKFPMMKYKIENKYFFYKESLLKRYISTSDSEINEVIEYVKENGLDYFNYSFKNNYDSSKIEVFWDETNSMFYVQHKGKKMYFPRSYCKEQQVKEYYVSLLIEQDLKSPHHYLDDGFQVEEGDIVIDAGAAEGMFTLDVIDRASKVYLVEADTQWVEALERTFQPYQHKVEIIEKYISSYDEGVFAKLDTIIHEIPNFIKMDIEGNEWDALRGARQLINGSTNLKAAICCYHSDFDQVLIEKYMDEVNMEHSTTSGYMWFPGLVRQNYVSNSLNRAVVRGRKKND